MKSLDWVEFNDCVQTITSICTGKNLVGVYGLPRGGLCLAVALSHALDIPFLKSPKSGSLVVDDIYETGRTLARFKNIPDITFFVWISKSEPEWWNAVTLCEPNEWVVFPWENNDLALKDQINYRYSRLKF